MNRKARPQRFLCLWRMVVAFTIQLMIFCIPTFGCSCPETFTPPCALNSRADVVFIGTLAKTDPPAYESGHFTMARFSVDEALKGISGREAEVEFVSPHCSVRLSIGERYLVYAHRESHSDQLGGLVSGICDGSKLLASATYDLQYLRSLSKTKVHQSILGMVSGIRGAELNGIQVTARSVDWTGRSEVDEKGFYKFELLKPGRYDIAVVVPLTIRVLAEPGLELVNETSQSVLKYSTNVKSGECHYKELRVIRVYSSTIQGKVVDASRQPIPRLSVYLYEFSDRPAFHSLGGEIVGTDEAGNYVFKSVKEGKYFLGVNLGGLPNFFDPYPPTFYPGVSSIEEASVVSVGADQQLVLDALMLLLRAVEQVVTGQLIWPDGTPVVSTEASRPSLYLMNPHNLDGIKSARPDGSNTIRIESDGSFSFIAFEGHTYIIHVDACNPQGQEMHAKHMKLRIDKNMKPLTLILSLPGNGRDRELIKKELDQMK